MKFLSKFIKAFGVVFLIALAVLGISLTVLTKDLPENSSAKVYSNYINGFEENFFDYRIKPHIEKDNHKRSEHIVLLDIDDESLEKINTWPVPREHWATLLNNMNLFGAKVIAFDVLFAEETKSCGGYSPDDDLAQSIKDFQSNSLNKVVLAYSTQEKEPNDKINDAKKTSKDLKNPNHELALKYLDNVAKKEKSFFSEDDIPASIYNSIVNTSMPEKNSFVYRGIEKHTWPLEKFLTDEIQIAYLNMEEDSDGVFRHYLLAAQVFEATFFSSLAVASYNSFVEDGKKININQYGMEGSDEAGEVEIKIEDDSFYLNRQGEVKVRWVGNKKYFNKVPMHKVLFAKKDDQELKKFFENKIVFIGSSATGAHDLRNTGIDPKLPGVYVHMTVAEMLLTKYFHKPLSESVKYSLYILISFLFLLLLTMWFGKAIIDLLVLVGLCVLAYYIEYKYFIPEGFEIKLFSIYFALLSTYSWITFLNFNQASAEKKQIKGAFSRYVAPAIVNDMLDNPDKLKVGGERKDITCMFSDVRDFTSISEKLTPTELAMALNRYMGEMTDIVFETRGTLDKYIGDAIVAFWGAPLDIGDHVNYAMDAAVKMMEALPAINEEFESKGLPKFEIGLGLNSGECSVGNMGSDQIFAYTALGDNMNLGARLESLCKHYGAQILVSEYTFERMDQERFSSRLIDKVKVKGKTQPVGVYEVLYSYHAFFIDQIALKNFKKGYQLFLDGNFTDALSIFKNILSDHPNDKASNRLKDACEHWIQSPPEEGDDHTITTMTTK